MNEKYILKILPHFYALFIFLYLLTKIKTIDFQIIEFNSREYRSGHFALNSKGDMILEYSFDNYRLFYGLKSNGTPFFENDNFIKEIELDSSGIEVEGYYSKNIFVTPNDNSNKQYLLRIDLEDVAELHDLETGE